MQAIDQDLLKKTDRNKASNLICRMRVGCISFLPQSWDEVCTVHTWTGPLLSQQDRDNLATCAWNRTPITTGQGQANCTLFNIQNLFSSLASELLYMRYMQPGCLNQVFTKEQGALSFPLLIDVGWQRMADAHLSVNSEALRSKLSRSARHLAIHLLKIRLRISKDHTRHVLHMH